MSGGGDLEGKTGVGCWNATDGLTGLPIPGGSAVYVVLIGVPQQSRSYNGWSYANEHAFPLALPFYAMYDEYGGVDEVRPDYNTRCIAERFRAADFTDWVNERVVRDEARFTTPGYIYEGKRVAPRRTFGIGLSFFLESVVDALPQPRGEVDTIASAEQEFDLLRDYLESQRERLSSPDEEHAKGWRTLFELGSGCPKLTDHGLNYAHALLFRGHGYGGMVGLEETYKDHLIEQLIVSGLDDPCWTALYHDFMTFVRIDTALSLLRRTWLPGSGRGSQQTNYRYYADFFAAAGAVARDSAAAEEAERRSWNDGTGSEEEMGSARAEPDPRQGP